jgi:hypothetical protein
MRLYPDLPVRRANTAVLDAATLIAIVVFALLGLWVHNEVAKLDILGHGVHDAGAAVQNGFDSAANAVHGTPLVGGAIAGGLRDAGKHTGGPVAEAGDRGVRRVHRVATLLGLLVFGLPTAMLLSRYLPVRVDQVRKLTAASRVLRDGDETRRRLVAERAAFGLPYGVLLRYTPDPIGDLAAGRHDALIAAALEDAGLRRAERRAEPS